MENFNCQKKTKKKVGNKNSSIKNIKALYFVLKMNNLIDKK